MSHEQLIGTTQKERNELVSGYNNTIQEHEAKINEFNKAICQVEEKSSNLAAENREKLNRRSAVDKQIQSIKGKAALLIILGIVALAAGVFLTLKINLLVGIVISVLGLVGIVFGCIIYPRWKQFADEQAAAYKELEEFDRINDDYNKEIAKFKDKIASENREINVLKLKIDDVHEYEKYEEFYLFKEKASHGYVAIMATADVSIVSDEPTPPKEGKHYGDSAMLSGAEVYLNGMRYCLANFRIFTKQKGCFGIVEIEEEGVQKLETCVGYKIVQDSYVSESAPVPIRKSNPSVFIWEHISVCKRGTQVYRKVYNDFEEFMKATSLTKEDVLKCLKS